MIKSYTLFSSEVDEPPKAVRDLTGQLAEIHLCQNSVGILVCHYDYIESGLMPALKAALPFPLVGITTFYQATPKRHGLFELTVTVLTSDDVRFALACSAADGGRGDPTEMIRHTYQRAFALYGESPSLILSFISANRPVSGDEYLRRLDAASGGVPSFGFVNSGEDESGANIYIISDGEPFSDGVAMLLLLGETRARMYVGDPPEARLLALRATVTAAAGNLMREINGQPAAAYLRKNGIALGDPEDGIITSIPFYCRMPGDEAFVGRLLQGVLPDGTLSFMGEVPEGTLLHIGAVTTEDILQESRETLRLAVSENPGAALFLIGSCVGRFITLGLDTTSEMDEVTRVMPAGTDYLACYVGGEICPVQGQGRPVNRYHNNSFIVLALY